MRSVKIYGRSDDLIEVDGDFEDEFNPPYCDWAYLHFDEGTVLKIGYDLVDDKGWHIEVVRAGLARSTFRDPEMDDGDHYTDVLELHCEDAYLKSAKLWSAPDGPSDGDVEDFFERFDVDDYNIDALREAMRILDGARP
jgi:hypothetical protein